MLLQIPVVFIVFCLLSIPQSKFFLLFAEGNKIPTPGTVYRNHKLVLIYSEYN